MCIYASKFLLNEFDFLLRVHINHVEESVYCFTLFTFDILISKLHISDGGLRKFCIVFDSSQN